MSIKYSEACLISGTWLLVSGNVAIGYTLIAASAVFALMRASLEYAEKKAKQEAGTESVKVLAETFSNALLTSGLFNGKTGKKSVKAVVSGAKKVVKKAGNVVKSAISKVFSDIRLKTNIEFIGKSPSNINIYSFSYIGNPTKYVGVIAHEVPWASEKHSSGYLMVDYNKLDVEFKRLN